LDYKPHAIGRQEIILPSTARTVEVNYYGDGGDPLVFLHGSGMHPQAYRSLFEAMVEENPNLQSRRPLWSRHRPKFTAAERRTDH